MNYVDYNHRRQLTSIKRDGSDPGTTLTYHPQGEGFRLSEIRHGNATDALPDFFYGGYDNLGNLQQLTTKRWGYQDVQTFEYDGVSRLTSASSPGTTGIPAYDYDYSYGPGGNLSTRVNNLSGQTRSYVYGTVANHHIHAVMSITGEGPKDTFGYDNNGNMLSRKVDDVSYTQEFDVENRLTKVTKGSQVTGFYYDADGNRTLTLYGTGTSQVKVYTPFPDFEESIPTGGSVTQRTSYTLAGQLIAVRVRVGTSGNGTLSYAYTDHLGSISAQSP